MGEQNCLIGIRRMNAFQRFMLLVLSWILCRGNQIHGVIDYQDCLQVNIDNIALTICLFSVPALTLITFLPV